MRDKEESGRKGGEEIKIRKKKGRKGERKLRLRFKLSSNWGSPPKRIQLALGQNWF